MKKLAPANPQPNTTMDTTEQIKAIATACGWTSCESIRGSVFGFPPGILDEGQFFDKSPPDYLSDLNACHSMEKTLTYEELYDYWKYLEEIMEEILEDEASPTGVDLWHFHATAPHRCKAFLLTKGEWKP